MVRLEEGRIPKRLLNRKMEGDTSMNWPRDRLDETVDENAKELLGKAEDSELKKNLKKTNH